MKRRLQTLSQLLVLVLCCSFHSVQAQIDLTLQGTDPTCGGFSNGSVTTTVTGGWEPYTYIWNTGATTADLFSLGAGTYAVTVMDVDGALNMASITLAGPTMLSGNFQSGTGCTNNGSATINVTGGVAPYNYNWGNGITGQTQNGLANGNYCVTVTDVNLCGIIVCGEIGEDLAVTTEGSMVACADMCDGSVNALVTGGTGPYNVVWNTGFVGSTLAGVTPGIYTVTVTDANGCTATATGEVTAPPPIIIDIIATQPACGGTTGAAQAIGSGGVMPYNYQWSNGQAGSSISNLSPGIYTVTLTDANGCLMVESVEIINAPNIQVNVTGANPTCANTNSGSATVTPTGGTAPFSYQWSNGGNTQTISGLVAGTYAVTVTDINGCTVNGNITLNAPAGLNVTIASSNASCALPNGGTATANVTNGMVPYSYLWSNGANTQSIMNVGAGTYTVTVTDDQGCTGTASVQITLMQSPLDLSFDSTAETSCNANNGTATVNTTSGTAPFSYQWSNGGNAQTISGLVPGNYTVTVTDQNGCSGSGTVNVASNNNLDINLMSVDATCGQANGSATAIATNGAAPYTYAWSNGGNTQSITGLSAGTYTVTVSDFGGCSAIGSTTVNSSEGITVNATKTNVSCFAGSNGAAFAQVSGGEMPYSYAWSNGANTQNINNLTAGTYTVTATDATGCTATASVIVTQPSAININLSSNNPGCVGLGSITANVSGGTPNYSYAWSNGQNTQTIINLAAGTYTVTVIDANGCTSTSTMTLTNTGSNLSVTTNASPVSCNGGNDGSATAFASAGSAPYTYAWSNGQDTQTATGLTAGNYTVTATDANGCTGTNTVTIGQPTAVSVVTTVISDACNGQNNGEASAQGFGGSGGYTFTWSTGFVGSNISGLAAGIYGVTATDTNGCSGSSSVTINSTGSTGDCNAFVSESISTFNGNDGEVAVLPPNGAVGPYTYAWSNGANTSIVTGLSAGTYNVTVTDGNGCTSTCSVTLVNASKVGDFVWFDTNQNGQQDAGEQGVAGVQVTLTGNDVNGASVNLTLTTGSDGMYMFDGLLAGTYKITFANLPADSEFSPQNIGNDATDSDVNPTTGMTDFFTIGMGEMDLTFDAGIFSACDNITDPGQICCDQTLCGPGNTPNPIFELVGASGGSGVIEHFWMFSTAPGPFNPGTWQAIPNTNSPNYAPGQLFETTRFVRCVRREGCIDFDETNIVTVTVGNEAIAEISAPTSTCPGTPVTFTATNAGAGATYNWNFGVFADPQTATGQTVTVTFTSWTVANVMLTVNNNGCSASNFHQISVPNCAGGGNLNMLLNATIMNGEDVMLDWISPEVLNGQEYMFFVGRSNDGIDFNYINQVAPDGTQSYSFYDESARAGLSYYRITVEDSAGNRSHSNVEEINLFRGEGSFMLFPNPTLGDLNIEIDNTFATDIELSLINTHGQLVRKEIIAQGSMQYATNIADLPSGLYFAQFNYGEKGIQTYKLIKR